MPNQTIYIREGDQEMFARAREALGDNLSQIVTEAVRTALDDHEAQAAGWTQVMLRPWHATVGGRGPSGEGRIVRFVGRRLAEYDTHYPDARSWVEGTIYVTRRGTIIVEHLSKGCWEGSRISGIVARYASLDEVPTEESVMGSEEDEQGAWVPPDALAEAREALGEEPAEIIE